MSDEDLDVKDAQCAMQKLIDHWLYEAEAWEQDAHEIAGTPRYAIETYRACAKQLLSLKEHGDLFVMQLQTSHSDSSFPQSELSRLMIISEAMTERIHAVVASRPRFSDAAEFVNFALNTALEASEAYS